MNRSTKLADLILHGYVAYADPFGWVAIFSAERSEGRMCKYFAGRGWDVRAMQMLGTISWQEIAWEKVTDDHLAQLLLEKLPPKMKHPLTLPPNLDMNMDLS
jgi:hypothetical protein